MPVRFRRGQISRDGVLYGYAADCDMRRIVEWPGRVVPLAPGGAVITDMLAEILGVQPGERLRIELLVGDRSAREITVAALVEEPMGLNAHMRQADVDALLGEETLHDLALLRVDRRLASEVDRRLAEMPAVGAMTRRDAALAKFREQSGEAFLSTAIVLTLFAASIAVGMVYNTARIALALRSRELATLRVLGFTRHEVSSILLGELAVQVLLGLPVGALLGRWLALGVASLADPELYRFPSLVSSRTYVLGLAVVILAAAASASFVLRRLERLDLVAVLKTRE